MKQLKNPLTLFLMFSSVVLLLVLQFFWIRNSYNKAFDDLKKETNGIFRTTIFSMRDSLIQQALESMPTDSALRMIRSRKRLFWDGFEDGTPSDTGRQRYFHGRRPGVDAPNYSGPAHEPIRRTGKPGPNSGDLRERDFIFRLGPDSLKVDSIAWYFRKALTKAGIEFKFRVVSIRRGDKRAHEHGSFISEVVRLNAIRRYAVIISNSNGLLMRAILPQALFSIFLTAITTLSFYVLYRNIRAQQRLVQLKNDFISNITHELKTPITTVSVALEALKNFQGLGNPKLTEEYLSIAQNELSRLTALTDEILKTAVYEENGIAFKMEAVDIEKLVTSVLGSLKLILEKNGASVTFEKQGTNFSIKGDPHHLTNVIYNLVDNALKYSSPPVMINIILKEAPAGVTLSVSDNGPGIAAEHQKKIFEKFFRVPTGDVHNVKGYGLGLSYVESVIKNHKGSIAVRSDAGKGSLFIINLPGLSF